MTTTSAASLPGGFCDAGGQAASSSLQNKVRGLVRKDFDNAVALTRTLAHAQASLSTCELDDLCRIYGSGSDLSAQLFERLCQAAHLCAFHFITLGEVARFQCLGLGDADYADRAVAIGMSIQDRAIALEKLFDVNALGLSSVFYDDLIDQGVLDALAGAQASEVANPERVKQIETVPAQHAEIESLEIIEDVYAAA